MGHEVSDEQRQKMREAATGKTQSTETVDKRKQTIKAMGGYKHSAEIKERIGASKRGRRMNPLSDDTKAKLRESIGSLVWITDGASNRRIQKTEPVPTDWRLGRASK